LPPAIEHVESLLPLIAFDAQEVVSLALFEKRNTLGHFDVADDDARFGLGERARLVEGLDQGANVVAIDALCVPTERLEPLLEQLVAGDLGRWTIGLLVDDIDDADQVVQLPMTRRPCGFPERALA
jgi:hypothetical protein